MEKEEKEIYRNELAKRQLVIKEQKLPVIIMVDGWGAAGKGSAIAGMIKYMDPRFFKVYNMDTISQEEERRPFLYRYGVKIPQKGQFSILDGSYMDELVKKLVHKELTHKEYAQKLRSILCFERSLRDNGYLIVKFFLQIDQHTQKERFEKLLEKKNTDWRVTKADLHQNEHYHKYKDCYEDFMEQTGTMDCPWHRIDAGDKEYVESTIANTVISAIDERIAHPIEPDDRENPFSLRPCVKLQDIPLQDCCISTEEYKQQLKELQKELKTLHNKLYRRKIPVIIAYEGWDAAGKGGNIKRVASALDPRGYEVFPIASPTPEEKNRHFLWRFYNRLPKTGHVAIFDRTWYGRVMVERLEGFCSENDWHRAYREINEFERDLTDWGAIVIKFWIQIDKDTQLERFNLRQNTPEKQWKITEEDWRNRDKWDQYEVAVNEMLERTNTEYAPWYVLESVDKKYARIKALKIIIESIRDRMEKEKEHEKDR